MQEKRNNPKKQKEIDRVRETSHDKTLADSFPSSDPPSSIPDPEDRSAPGGDIPAEKGPESRQ